MQIRLFVQHQGGRDGEQYRADPEDEFKPQMKGGGEVGEVQIEDFGDKTEYVCRGRWSRLCGGRPFHG